MPQLFDPTAVTGDNPVARAGLASPPTSPRFAVQPSANSSLQSPAANSSLQQLAQDEAAGVAAALPTPYLLQLSQNYILNNGRPT